MRRPSILLGALGVVVAVAAVVVGGALSVPANAVTVDGASISRAALDNDLATIQQNPAFNCYLDASVAVRSNETAGLPAIGGSGRSGTYNTTFVDFWLSQQINNLLIEHLADSEHLSIGGGALTDGRADLVGSIDSTLAQAAIDTGQGAVCAPSAQAIIATLPSGLVAELVQAQAAGDLVLARAAGYSLSTADLARYYAGHTDQFQTICLSAIETASEAGATLVRGAIEGGASFAAVAKADSTDATSAANGGSLGCFAANEGAYATVANDVKGLSVGQLSQPIATTGGSYLILEVTSYQPTTFSAVVGAVRQAVLQVGSTKAGDELAAFAKHAQVSVDPRYGRWAGASGVGIEAPRTPPAADLLSGS